MIKGIGGGRYIIVNGGNPSTTYISPGAVGSGQMRYNGNTNCIEINDGNMWKQLNSSFSTVQLDAEAESLLDWAKEQRKKQCERERAVRNNPALTKAYEAIKRAEENFDLLETIAREHDNNAGMEMSESSGP